ncbi:VOC family protein [Gelidibacter maritimus]|nr:VOC family protein [Gelidibacter maritimus]
MKKPIRLIILTLILFGCSEYNTDKSKVIQIDKLQSENDSLKTIINKDKTDMKTQISTFLTFQENNAEEAMNFYVELFDNSEIVDVQRYGKDGPAKEGTIMKATFKLNGKEFICSDSPIKHEWDFTPGVSIWVECESDEELKKFFEKLSENGKVMMPIDNYGFSQKFSFVEDKFGVSWQLNLQ